MNNAATSSSPVSGPGTSTRNPSARRPPPLAKVTVASNCARYSSTLMPRAHLFRSAVRQTSVLGRFLAAPGHDVRSTCSDLGHRPLRQGRSEEHTSELQSLAYLVCRLLLEKNTSKSSHSFLSKQKNKLI